MSAAPGSTPTAPEARLATVLGGIVAVLVVLLPVLFGVGFPYSLAAAELTVWALLVVCVWRVPLRLRDQLALIGLAMGLGLHVFVLRGDLGVVLFGGSCLSGDFRGSDIDTAAAVDSFRRGFACLALFVAVRALAASPRVFRTLSVAVALSAVVLLGLGLLAPQDSRNILWFFAKPTYDFHWLSSSINSLLTDLWAYSLPYHHAGLDLYLDEFMVSSRPVGPVFNGNHYVGAVGATFPVLLAYLAQAVAGRGRVHWPMSLPLGLGVIAVVYWLSHSVGGALAMLASLGVFLYVCRRPEHTGRSLALVGIGALAVCVLVPALQAQRELVALGARPAIWLQTVQAFFDHPLLGVGLGNFADLRLGSLEWRPVRWYSPHNLYLHLLVTLGLVGIAWLVGAARVMASPVPRASTAAGQVLVAGLCASLGFTMAHAALDYAPGLPFNALLTAVVAGLFLGRGAGTAASRPRAGSLGRQVVAPLVVTLIALWLAVSSVQFAYAQLRTFETKDLVASALSQQGFDDDLRVRLAGAVSQNEQACRRLPPRKDYLLAMVHAHVLLAGDGQGGHLSNASAYLERHLAIGRRDGSLLLLRRWLDEQQAQAPTDSG